MRVSEISPLFHVVLKRSGFTDLLTIKHNALDLLNCAENDYEHDAVAFALEYILRKNACYISAETKAFIDSMPAQPSF